MEETKECNKCGESKPLYHFERHTKRNKTKSVTYLRNRCKSCREGKIVVPRQDKNSWGLTYNTYEYDRARLVLRNYGLTSEEYKELQSKQDGKCDICKVEMTTEGGTRECVDHCHTTGKVRGLLCGRCNSGIGFLMDDIENLNAAIVYLEKH